MAMSLYPKRIAGAEHSVLVALAAAFVAVLALGGVIPTPGSESVPDLYQASSLVFAGQILSVKRVAEQDGYWGEQPVRLQLIQATARVDRQYKGPSDLTLATITYWWPVGTPCLVSRCESLSAGEYGLFFLSKDEGGYRLLNPYFGKFHVSRLISAQHSPGVLGLEADLVAGLQDSDTTRLLANIELIGALGHVESFSPLLNVLAINKNATVRAAVYAALLRLQNYTELGASLRTAEEPAGNPAEVAAKARIIDLVSEIRDPSTVEVLIEFSHTRSVPLRQSVIHALRTVAAPDAVPTLVGALDDPVQLIRYDAVLGLASVTKDWNLAPSVEEFEGNERQYIDAWKLWWVRSGNATYQRRR